MNRQTFTLSGEVGYASPELKTLAIECEGAIMALSAQTEDYTIYEDVEW